ncbi:MAG: methionine--tRNA ligase, partial [Candidatus Nomurabacteria bacterium]|nr:methionine--tRNA ligase [Candidatus Nomurabacteria bacterium]
MKKYITTAIPYANAVPHIGTAMDYLYGDILLRYWSANGDDVLMSVGTDEHGTKVAQKAADENILPQEFVDNLQKHFKEMRMALNLKSDNLLDVRTTNPEHKRRVQEIWKKLDENKLIYKHAYEGWYCTGCEAFVTETEAREMDYNCSDHNKKLERLSEENYYLRVSQFEKEIRKFIETSIVPEFRGKELLEMIKDGVQDVSISRPREKLEWGVPVPGDDSQVMYVWVDALSNYITALGYPDKNWNADFWPADVEIVGKDILRFHAIIWPAILLGVGLDLPKKILVHGFINVDGQKMSKSLGNVVAPSEIIEKYGADAFRYYFTRHIPTFEDGDFTWEKFETAHNGELANDLGNLVSRVANMIKKYEISRENLPNKLKINENFADAIENFETQKALEMIWGLVQQQNQFIDENQPWQLAKTDHEKLEDVMTTLWQNLLDIANYLAPFLPETAQKIHNIFSGKKLPDEIPILFPKKYLHTEEPKR